jgi:WD40 repeat protein
MFLFNSSKKSKAPAVKPAGEVGVGSQAVYALLPWRGLLVSGTADGVVRIWEPKGGALVQELRGHSQAVVSLVAWEDCIASGAWAGGLRGCRVVTPGGCQIVYKDHAGGHHMNRVLTCRVVALTPGGCHSIAHTDHRLLGVISWNRAVISTTAQSDVSETCRQPSRVFYHCST